MMFTKLKILGAAALAGVLALGGLRAFAVQFGGIGGDAGEPAKTESPAPDSREALSRSVDKIRAELAGAARRSAELEKEIKRLQAELQATASQIQRLGQESARPKSQAALPTPNGPVPKPVPAPAALGGFSVATKPALTFQPVGVMDPAALGGRGFTNPGGMMGGFGGGGPLSYHRFGPFLVVASPRGDKVTAYNTQSKEAKSLRLSESKDDRLTVLPVEWGNYLALTVRGSKITRIATFSLWRDGPSADGAWYPQDLKEPVENASPIVANDVAIYTLGRRVYAYSNRARRWDVLELPNEIDARSMQQQPTPTFRLNDHIYEFNIDLGRWNDIDLRAILDAPEEKNAGNTKKTASPRGGVESDQR